MSFRLASDQPAADALRAALCEQAERIRLDPDDPAVEAVLRARTRIKKVRAALRLAQPFIGGATRRTLNAGWRDAARTLAPIRDASAARESLARLEPFLTGKVGAAAVAGALRSLSARELRARRSPAARTAGRMFTQACGDLREQTLQTDWSGAQDGGWPTVVAGVAASYRKARSAAKRARRSGADAEAFHEWRKRAKIHLLHLRLLREGSPPQALDRIAEVAGLVRRLGELNDVKVLIEALSPSPDRSPSRSALLDALAGELSRRMQEAAEAGRVVFRLRPREAASAYLSDCGDAPREAAGA